MNTIAKLSASIAGMADRDAVGSSPSDGVGSDGWAEDLLRRAGLPVSHPRRLDLEALRGRDRPVTAQDLQWELKLDSRAASTRHRATGLSGLSHPGDPGRPQTGALLSPRWDTRPTDSDHVTTEIQLPQVIASIAQSRVAQQRHGPCFTVGVCSTGADRL